MKATGIESIENSWGEFLEQHKKVSSKEAILKYVIKRDGTLARYEQNNISEAIRKAFLSVRGEKDEKLIKNLSQKVESKILERNLARHRNSAPAIEEIQDLVEIVLIENGIADVAKAYILYRAQRETMRDMKKLMVDIDQTMDGYLAQSDWRVNENANVNFSLGGLILHNSGTLTANYWLKNIYPEDIADAHKNADFHIHDLSMFSGYCAGWSLRQLIAEGLGGVPGKISSKPAKHLSTLSQQIVNFLGVMQNEWAGAQALSSFDTYLAPFVRTGRLSEADVRQSLQSFIFGVNTPSRWGSQAPFTNVTFDWVVPDDLKDRPAVVGGKEQAFTYGNCQPEMDCINKIFIELMLDGDSEGRGFQYPIPTYNITENFDWDSPNARLLFTMTSKYGTPYFQNFLNSDLNPNDVRSMCCRLQLDKRELRKKGGGLFGSDELTGSIGVVTINLPRIGYLAQSRDDFFYRLDRLLNLASQSLVIKKKIITRLMNGGLFPYTRRYLKNLDSHFCTIGLVGMNECLLNFMKTDITSEKGKTFALEVITYMKKRIADFQESTGCLFNLEATPAESTSYRLARHDKKAFPDILTSGEKEPYYTNSTQLPVDYTTDIFEALDLQENLQAAYTGGTVFHAFLGEALPSWEASRNLVKTIASNYRIPYFTISPVFSICPEHGYLSGEQVLCPRCSENGAMTETEVYSRIVGYYRSVKNWNRGKLEEHRHRSYFSPLSKEDEKKKKTQVITPLHVSTDTPADLIRTPHSYLYFFRKTCPNCPPVHSVVESLHIKGLHINTDEQSMHEMAEKHNIFSVPTVIFLDEKGCEVFRTSNAQEVKQAGEKIPVPR